MIIYPTMELKSGRCVTLTRGRLEEPSIWHVDPVETARDFAAAGAEWMHVTDFDAVEGTGDNDALVEEIIRSAGIPVQVAGGFRSRDRVEEWIEKGAGRVVLGTMAARDPQSVKALAKQYPDQVVVALDVWQGQLMTDGWRSPAAISPEAYLAAFENEPLAAVMITDIDADIEDSDGSLALISQLSGQTRHHVIASGIVRGVDDISRLKYVHNISGAVVGRALFNKAVDLEEALTVARPEPEEVAEFI